MINFPLIQSFPAGPCMSNSYISSAYSVSSCIRIIAIMVPDLSPMTDIR